MMWSALSLITFLLPSSQGYIIIVRNRNHCLFISWIPRIQFKFKLGMPIYCPKSFHLFKLRTKSFLLEVKKKKMTSDQFFPMNAMW
jgi:hypothetical protein